METLTPQFEWGVAHFTLVGQHSGDHYLVKSPLNGANHTPPQQVLFAVIDGLGHGEGASIAARSAVDALQESASDSVTALLKHCHSRLLRTRGVVMSLALFNLLNMTILWGGVGNVDGVLLRADSTREHLPSKGGVIGYRLPNLRETAVPLRAGDTLILTTDGIRSTYRGGLNRALPPQAMADHILAAHARKTDDALVLVARFKEKPA